MAPRKPTIPPRAIKAPSSSTFKFLENSVYALLSGLMLYTLVIQTLMRTSIFEPHAFEGFFSALNPLFEYTALYEGYRVGIVVDVQLDSPLPRINYKCLLYFY
ncbi:hypothetical protein B0H13DRAFT_1936083 [Mycena leptocephala]|nr:hypothetical protein B0H13DRAFT_1936083 [Mycena leptocephala]